MTYKLKNKPTPIGIDKKWAIFILIALVITTLFSVDRVQAKENINYSFVANGNEMFHCTAQDLTWIFSPSKNTNINVEYKITSIYKTWYRVSVDNQPFMISSGHKYSAEQIKKCQLNPILEKEENKYWLEEKYIPPNIRMQVIDMVTAGKTTLSEQSFGIKKDMIIKECPSLSCENQWLGGWGGMATVVGKNDLLKDWYKIVVSDVDINHFSQIGSEGWMQKDSIPSTVLESFADIEKKNQAKQDMPKEEKWAGGIKNSPFFINVYKYKTVLYIIFLITASAFFFFFTSKEEKEKIIRNITDWQKRIIEKYFFKKDVETKNMIKKDPEDISQTIKEAEYIIEKITQKVSAVLVAVILFIIIIGASYGLAYNHGVKIIKEVRELAEKKQHDKAIDLLEETKKKIFFRLVLGQRIEVEIEKTKRLKIEEELFNVNMVKNQAELKIEQAKTKENLMDAQIKQKEFENQLQMQKLNEKEAEERKNNADNDGDGLTYRQELELGTSDWNNDTDGDGIKDGEDLNPTGGGRNQAQSFAWKYGEYNWTYTANIHEDWYNYYKNKKNRETALSAKYVTYEDPFIKRISKHLEEEIKKNSMNKGSFVLSFVQNLSYVDDKYTGHDEYPKYPVETFFEKNGDCEDTSYLTASIMRAMEIDVVLVVLPRHMAVGVWMDCGYRGSYYKINDKCYYYMETTNTGWEIGEMPEEHRYSVATIIKIPSGDKITNVFPVYGKKCYPSVDFYGYYSDGTNLYSDSNCNNYAHCVKYKEYYSKSPYFSGLYWDSSCTQIVVSGCSKAIYYPGYFFSGGSYYRDSSCTQITYPNTTTTYRYQTTTTTRTPVTTTVASTTTTTTRTPVTTTVASTTTTTTVPPATTTTTSTTISTTTTTTVPPATTTTTTLSVESPD